MRYKNNSKNICNPFNQIGWEPHFFLVLEWAVSRLGQDPFKPDIARNDHHRTKQTITANEIDM